MPTIAILESLPISNVRSDCEFEGISGRNTGTAGTAFMTRTGHLYLSCDPSVAALS
jgi:hypothetical protein